MNRADAEQIITELMKPLYGFALKRCVNIQDAEDLIQEICLKAFRALTLRDDIVDARKFVWTVARNTLANYYRGKQSGGIGVFIDDLSGLPASDDDVHEQIIRDETETRHTRKSPIFQVAAQNRCTSYYEHKSSRNCK